MELLKKKAVIDKKTKQTVAILESDDLATYIDRNLFDVEEIDFGDVPFFFVKDLIDKDTRIKVYESEVINNYYKEIIEKYNIVQLLEIFLSLINSNENINKTEEIKVLEKAIELGKRKMQNKINTAKKITSKFKYISIEEEKEAALKLQSMMNKG